MLLLRWRPPAAALTLRWIVPAPLAAVARPELLPQLAAVIGTPGRNGVDGSIPLRVETAAVALSGHRAVFVGGDGAFHPCQPDLTARLCVGITIGAAAQGADATAQTGGIIEEPSWSWNATGPVWIGAEGILTQVPPIAGALCQVGTPAGANALRIDPRFYALL